MAYERTGYAPWSLTREAGVQSATVDGTVKVPQYIQPTLDTGFVDEKGNWKGIKSSDDEFIGLSKAEGVANGADALFPETITHIDMTGFSTLQFALKVTSAGNYSVTSVYGPQEVPFANLSPIQPADKIKIIDSNTPSDETIFDDTLVLSYTNAWFIVTVLADRAKGQRNMQVKVTNGTGSASDIEFGFMRLV
jgi:hypothetical protein